MDQSWRRSFMRKSWLLCVLLGTLAWGQAAPPPQAVPGPAGGQPVDTSASVPPDAPVITVNGVCPAQPKTTAAAKGTAAQAPATKTSAADCKTVNTKAQFEELADALSPKVTPQV